MRSRANSRKYASLRSPSACTCSASRGPQTMGMIASLRHPKVDQNCSSVNCTPSSFANRFHPLRCASPLSIMTPSRSQITACTSFDIRYDCSYPMDDQVLHTLCRLMTSGQCLSNGMNCPGELLLSDDQWRL